MSPVFEVLWAEYEPLVQSLAYEFGAKGHRWGAEHDDFRQEFVCWMLREEPKLKRKRAEITDADQFGKWLARCLRNEGNDYLVDIRDGAGGQPRHGAYWYSEAEVKELLPSMFDPEKWHEPPVSDGGGRVNRIPAEGGNWIATLADVARAYDSLNIEERDIIKAIYRDGVRNVDLAGEWSVSEAAMSSRHHRALAKIHKALGGPKPSPMRRDVPGDPFRGRHAISSAHARALTSSYYEGENS
jgi:DNA-directed RNA polymerase specialized sigma24 family protein